MPCGGVAADFQPSYALEAPGVTRDELVVRFDPRSPRLHRPLALRLSRVHDLPQGVSRAVVVAHWAREGVICCVGDPRVRNLFTTWPSGFRDPGS
jgi:hypothetical protein